MLQFVTSSGNESAKYHFSISDATNLDTDGVSTNRYLVLSKKLSDGLITPDFNWRDVRSLQVYASIQNGATSLTDYSISLDAIKFENKSNTNPLYGLVGYTVTQNGLPIVKDSGTKSLVEFKIALGMGLGG
jgi:hypothetical protein